MGSVEDIAAPRPAPDEHGRGTNQLSMRVANERLILALIRRHPGLAKAEIARLTGLTPQATTIIVNRLEADGLLKRQAALRGRVGQPAIPYELARDGAFSIGLKIGRRASDMVLMDFVAGVRRRLSVSYPYPRPETILHFAAAGYQTLTGELGRRERARLAGVGVAAPFKLWNWEAHLRAPSGAMSGWREVDLGAELRRLVDVPVQFCNDATSACGAELAFGATRAIRGFLYIYVDAFVGGGLVQDSRVVFGRSGNAAAVASLPVCMGTSSARTLLDYASISRLENMLEDAGLDRDLLISPVGDWAAAEPHLSRWIDEMAPALAQAGVSASALMEIEALVIDGAVPVPVRERIVAATREAMTQFDTEELTPYRIIEGSLGRDAPVIGSAALPLLDFALEGEE